MTTDCQEKYDIDVGAGVSVVLLVEVLAHQVALQEEQLGQQETLQVDGGRSRGWGSLGGSHQQGEQEAGEVDKDRLGNKTTGCWDSKYCLATETQLTMNFISAGLGWLVFYEELTGRARWWGFIVRLVTRAALCLLWSPLSPLSPHHHNNN